MRTNVCFPEAMTKRRGSRKTGMTRRRILKEPMTEKALRTKGSVAPDPEESEEPEEPKERPSRKKRTRRKKPPDGGWSWMVLLGVFVINMTTQPLFSVSGLIFGPPIKSWGYHVSEVAGVSTMMIAIQNFFGLATGLLMKRYTIRTVGAVGTILVFLGLVLASFASKIWELFFTWGFLVGVGMALIVPTSFVVLTLYFKRYRRYAVGIGMSGTGVGQMVLPLTIKELLDAYGFSGTCLIISSFALQALTGYVLCRPLISKKKEMLHEIVPVIEPVADSDTEMTLRITPKKRKWRWFRACSRAIGVPLLKDPSLANAIICSSIIYMTVACHTAATPMFMAEDGHLTSHEVASCLTVMSACDLAARIVMPAIQETFELSARTVYMVSSATGAVGRTVMAEYPNLVIFVITSVLIGASRAAVVVNINLALSEMVDQTQLMSAIGLSMVFKAFSTLFLGYFLGWLHKITGSFRLYMHAISLLVLFTVFSWLIELIITRNMKKKRRRRGAALEEAIEDSSDDEDGKEFLERAGKIILKPPERATSKESASRAGEIAREPLERAANSARESVERVSRSSKESIERDTRSGKKESLKDGSRSVKKKSFKHGPRSGKSLDRSSKSLEREARSDKESQERDTRSDKKESFKHGSRSGKSLEHEAKSGKSLVREARSGKKSLEREARSGKESLGREARGGKESLERDTRSDKKESFKHGSRSGKSLEHEAKSGKSLVREARSGKESLELEARSGKESLGRKARSGKESLGREARSGKNEPLKHGSRRGKSLENEARSGKSLEREARSGRKTPEHDTKNGIRFPKPAAKIGNEPLEHVAKNTAQPSKTKRSVSKLQEKKKESVIEEIFPIVIPSPAVSELRLGTDRVGKEKGKIKHHHIPEDTEKASAIEKITALKSKYTGTKNTTEKDRRSFGLGRDEDDRPHSTDKSKTARTRSRPRQENLSLEVDIPTTAFQPKPCRAKSKNRSGRWNAELCGARPTRNAKTLSSNSAIGGNPRSRSMSRGNNEPSASNNRNESPRKKTR